MSWFKKAQDVVFQRKIESILKSSNPDVGVAVSQLESIPNICDWLSAICANPEDGFYVTVFSNMCPGDQMEDQKDEIENQPVEIV